MLERRYTIPVVLGICLGIIMSGVQLSSVALDSALGNHKISGPVVIEHFDSRQLDGRVLGKDVTVNIPTMGSLPGGDFNISKEYIRDIFTKAQEGGKRCLDSVILRIRDWGLVFLNS
ncbi:MAG: hypothetical protein ACOY46_01395 [Bacillota bacterium]